jgi:hypothetical protein
MAPTLLFSNVMKNFLSRNLTLLGAALVLSGTSAQAAETFGEQFACLKEVAPLSYSRKALPAPQMMGWKESVLAVGRDEVAVLEKPGPNRMELFFFTKEGAYKHAIDYPKSAKEAFVRQVNYVQVRIDGKPRWVQYVMNADKNDHGMYKGVAFLRDTIGEPGSMLMGGDAVDSVSEFMLRDYVQSVIENVHESYLAEVERKTKDLKQAALTQLQDRDKYLQALDRCRKALEKNPDLSRLLSVVDYELLQFQKDPVIVVATARNADGQNKTNAVKVP